ncbi:MAG: rod shape-determining protein MreC [Thermoanaerobaculia bacterium]
MTRRRSQLLLAVLLVGQLFLLAAQEPDRQGAANLLEGVALRSLGPFAWIVDQASELFSSASRGARSRRELLAENRELRAELLELRRGALRLEGLEQENEGLARTLGFSRREPGRLRAAEIVYADSGSWLRSLILYVGGDSGVRINQPVLTADGLVGRVVRLAGAYAKVQLITDRSASVGVQLERSRRQAVLRGSAPGRLLLDYVPRQANVEVGEAVLTAGIDGVYPRGIPVGTVVSVEPGDEVLLRIVVEPAVNFSRLDFVYLLEGETVPPELEREGRDAAR